VKGRGTVRIETTNGETVKGIQLKNTLHVPDLRSNLMSVAKIVDAEYTVTFDKNRAEIRKKKDRDVLLIADRIGDFYYVRESPEQLACVSSANIKKSQLQMWHERLGHLNESDLLEMHKRAVLGMEIKKGEKLPPCEVCSSGKLTALSFPKSSQKNTDILDIIHTDVCGPMRTKRVLKNQEGKLSILSHLQMTVPDGLQYIFCRIKVTSCGSSRNLRSTSRSRQEEK